MEKQQIKYYTDKAKNLMDRVMACEELHDLDKTKKYTAPYLNPAFATVSITMMAALEGYAERQVELMLCKSEEQREALRQERITISTLVVLSRLIKAIELEYGKDLLEVFRIKQ